jgi:hypothetical protein
MIMQYLRLYLSKWVEWGFAPCDLSARVPISEGVSHLLLSEGAYLL